MEYALIVLKHISKKNGHELTTAREICDLFDAPFDTVSKVMQTLQHSEILDSSKGIKGGYSLAKNLNDVSFLELIQVIEGEDFGRSCSHPAKGQCELISKCNIVTPIQELNHRLGDFFKQMSLKELLKIQDKAVLS